jgi:hypothetical protein
MTQIHLNIIYVMSTLSQFTHNFNETQWKTFKQVFHYVHETLDVNIEYDLKSMNEQLKLQRYSDSDWDEDIHLRKLTLKYIFQLINKSVFWSLKH